MSAKNSAGDSNHNETELVEDPKSDDNEVIQYATDIIGEWGPLQARVVFTLAALGLAGATQDMGILFYAPRLDFWCKRPPGFENATKQTCHSYENSSLPCTEFEYDMDGYRATLTSEFNLVCDRDWLISGMKSIYHTGYMVSCILCGLFSDRFGRQWLVKWTFIFEVLFTICHGLSQSVTQFVVARFCLSLVGFVRSTSSGLLLLEVAGPLYRARIFMVNEFAFVFGLMMLSVIMFYVRHFRDMALIAAFYKLCFIYLVWKLPESLRWQMTHGEYDAAEKTILECVEKNKNMDKTEAKRRLVKLKKFLDKEEEQRAVEAKKTIIDLWKVPVLLRRCLILYVSWFVLTFRIDGFIFNIDDIGGSAFVNMFVQGLSHSFAISFTYYIVEKFDRRFIGMISFCGQGLAFAVMIPFLLAGASDNYITAIVFVMQFCVETSITFNLLSSEIFPTTLRQIGTCSCAIVSQLATVFSPFLNELTQATHVSVTVGLFAFLAFLNGALMYFLPETRNKEIPDTIEEAKNFNVKKNVES